ncbi:Uncharacterised protein [Legionella spiritensis]|nr:Uncharacterised protein [Legionella spiritensis]
MLLDNDLKIYTKLQKKLHAPGSVNEFFRKAKMWIIECHYVFDMRRIAGSI